MILNLPCNNGRTQVRRINWKQQIRRNLYLKNLEALKANERQSIIFKDKQKKEMVDESLQELIRSVQEITVSDRAKLVSCHSYYSSFVPLTIQAKFEDELSVAIPSLRRFEEAGRINQRVLLLMEITEFMRECAERSEADRGWLRCLRKYVCELDSLRALEIYLEIKKRGGVKPLSQIHKQFGGECMPRTFFERIQWCAEFLKPPKENIPKFQLSLQWQDEVSEVTMPKTMKQLYCCICHLYDCNQHSMQQSAKEREYHYAAPNNLVSPQNQTLDAIMLFAHYQHLLKMGDISKCQDPCSPFCYQKLDKISWIELQRKRGTLLSPLVKGVIKMGLHIFSYKPCSIWYLLKDRGLTCAMVFLFLLEDLNLGGRLERRLQGSEAEALLRIGCEEQVVKAEVRGRGRPRGKGERRKVQVAHYQKVTEITACIHYFLEEGAIDRGCENCRCRQRQFCLPQCLCDSDCPIRKRGCQCRKQDCRNQKCPCFKHNEECDPSLCHSCFAKEKSDCNNHQIFDKRSKLVRVGRSTIVGAGLGLFAGQVIKKGDLVMIYTGELIDYGIDLLREGLSVDSTFYNFSSKQGTIDARFKGNLARFINHADENKENLYAQGLLTDGRYKIAFFGKRDIEPDEELFFDYDGEGVLAANYSHKYPFISKKKNKKS